MTKEEKLKVTKEITDVVGVDEDDVCVVELNPFTFLENLIGDIIVSEKCKEEAKAKNTKELDFSDVFEKQAENQREMLKKGMYLNFSDMTKEQMYLIELPIDDTKICSYHVQQLMSEIGELLDADKRWKNFRNTKNNQKDKLEELADCFIELMNIAMFSGYDYNNVLNAIAKKVNKVHSRISNEK